MIPWANSIITYKSTTPVKKVSNMGRLRFCIFVKKKSNFANSQISGPSSFLQNGNGNNNNHCRPIIGGGDPSFTELSWWRPSVQVMNNRVICHSIRLCICLHEGFVKGLRGFHSHNSIKYVAIEVHF